MNPSDILFVVGNVFHAALLKTKNIRYTSLIPTYYTKLCTMLSDTKKAVTFTLLAILFCPLLPSKI